jgi:hypothetical protein
VIAYDDEQSRALANLESYYAQWLAAARDLDGPYKGSMRWKVVGGKQYLYHRLSNTPLAEQSLGRRTGAVEARFVAFQRGKAEALARHARALAESERFAKVARALRLGLVPSQAARLLRHFDRRAMLGELLMVVGTIAMTAYESHAGARLFTGFDATQDFDMAWRGADSLRLQAPPPVSLLGTLREIDPLFTKNTERGFQAVSGKYEVEILAAPSALASFPKNDLVPLGGMVEQEWLLLGRPVRHVLAASDGTPAPIVAPDPRWMALHKLWLSQKRGRQAVKRPKDQAQGLLLMRAVLAAMPDYPIDAEFVAQVPEELRGYLKTAVAWAEANPTAAASGEDVFAGVNLRAIAPGVRRKIMRSDASNLTYDPAYEAGAKSVGARRKAP